MEKVDYISIIQYKGDSNDPYMLSFSIYNKLTNSDTALNVKTNVISIIRGKHSFKNCPFSYDLERVL